MSKAISLILAFLAILAASGCATKTVYAERESVFISAAYDAVDALIKGQTKTPFIAPGGKRVLVPTVVDLGNLERSSAFGRLLAEQMASRLTQIGVSVSELKLRGNLFVNPGQGELILSREIREISSNQNADAVLVGTYTDAGDAVYVTLKLVRATDSTVSSAYNFAMVKSQTVASLLQR